MGTNMVHRRRDYSSGDSSAVCPSSQLTFLLSTPKFWSCLLFLTNMIVREGVSPSYYHCSCHLAKHFQQWLLVVFMYLFLCTDSTHTRPVVIRGVLSPQHNPLGHFQRRSSFSFRGMGGCMLSKSFETLLVRKVSFAKECWLTKIPLHCTFGSALADRWQNIN